MRLQPLKKEQEDFRTIELWWNLLPACSLNCSFMRFLLYFAALAINKDFQDRILRRGKTEKNMKFHKLAHIHSQLIFQFHFSQFFSFRSGNDASQPRYQTETKTVEEKREGWRKNCC